MSSALETAWERQRVWSLTANALNRRITVWRTVILLLAVAGAALVTLGAQLSGSWSLAGRVLSGLGAAALAVTPLIRRSRLGKNSVAEWNRARSASEGLKQQVFLYQSDADPYGVEDRDGILTKRTAEILDSVQDLTLYAAPVKADNKPLPPRLEPDAYIAHRVDTQIDGYYRPKAALMAQRLNQFRRLEYVLVLAAAGIGALAAVVASESVTTRVGAWVAVITTAGAALAAHIAATRYEYLVTTYIATANRLQSIRNTWLDQPAETRMSPSDFVHTCEDAISVENQAWMAKWAESPKTPTNKQR